MLSRRHFLPVPAALIHAAGAQLREQFVGATTLVLAPATVKDPSGKFIRGIAQEQFVVLDNGAPRAATVEEEPQAVSLILALHASLDARKPLDRFRKRSAFSVRWLSEKTVPQGW